MEARYFLVHLALALPHLADLHYHQGEALQPHLLAYLASKEGLELRQ